MSEIEHAALSEVASLNPREKLDLPPNEDVSFVPMSAVCADTGTIADEESRTFQDVQKGFTPFLDSDVLVAKITPCFQNGKIAQANITKRYGFGSTEFHVVRPNPEVLDSRFAFHFLRQPVIRIAGERRMTGSAGQRRVPKQFLAKLKIPILPLDEQKRISEVLDRAEALRARRRAALALLDELTQSIFLDMFGDPVGNQKGWTKTLLGDQLTYQRYGPRFYNEKYSEEGVRIVRITDLDSFGVLTFDNMPRQDVTDEEREKFLLKPGDIIFARTGATVGKVALIKEGDPECIAGAYFITLRFSPEIHPSYARAVLTSKSIQAIVWVRSQQSAQQNFSGPGLRALPMPVPPIELQRDFAKRVEQIHALKKIHESHLETINELFASLQSRAFKGELFGCSRETVVAD